MKNIFKKQTKLPVLPKDFMASEQDPTGKYTGVPLDGGKPEQDADDL
ncbi:MAG: hypothetical protein FWD76_01180 [Firmicutes bacterium]|nr:hypothetical protein [Bacillota bacterium]